MAIALITGSCGLIGSESVKFFHEKGFDVVGIDNNMREYFFGTDGSTKWKMKELNANKKYHHYDVDIRNMDELTKIFTKYGKEIKLIIHTAAQPSHDWAAKEPLTDFTVNALATLNLLEQYRHNCPDSVFIFTSTNKVYGDLPNFLPLEEKEFRYELNQNHPWYKNGIDESMSIDQCKHSIFGASKASADLMVQEYGRYFNLKTSVFRGGCLTGPAHSGAELHGFLAYLVKCAVKGQPYKIFGYKGKQVRDNIHSLDLVNCFWQVFNKPRMGEAYNIGGSRHSNCSILEAIQIIHEISGKQLEFTTLNENRIGDHIWWISDVSKFMNHYPEWKFTYDIKKILKEMIEVADQ